jgi:hypothetical protein
MEVRISTSNEANEENGEELALTSVSTGRSRPVLDGRGQNPAVRTGAA